MKKISKKSTARRLERRILTMLAFFSISIGLWENFRQLWLQDNGFSASDVSMITSLGTFISVAGVILVGIFVKPRYLKTFMTGVLIAKAAALLALFMLNRSGETLLINFCIILDVLTTYLIVVSVYPLITVAIKSNQVYSRRKLVEYLFRDLGVLVGGALIGQFFFSYLINYNACLLASVILLLPAIFIMSRLRLKLTEKAPARRHSIVKYVLSSHLQVVYMVYAFLAATSFAVALGLKMLVLTNYLTFTVGTATNYLLIVGLLSDIIGVVALKHFTPKNDYITMTIKFGIRIVAYIIAVLANDPFTSLLAITWSILISTAYEDVSDGYYINLVDNRHQFSYSTLKYVMTVGGEAVGMLLCGLTYEVGIPCMLGTSAAITVVQLGVAYHLIYLRHHRRRLRHSASRSRYDQSLAEAQNYSE